MANASWTNFCCRSGGNNLNAGTVTGDTTEPATTPLVTYTGGDYNATTNVYTAPVGADMTEAQVGRFATVYVDGDTAPTTNQWFSARITAVNAGARTVTVSGTAMARLGTETSTGTGTRSMRIGGAWAGPSGTNLFPFNLTNLASATNTSNDGVRVNFKNDQTYAMTAAITVTSTPACICGYSSTYQDGGKAIIDGGTSGASYVLFTAPASMRLVQDIHFRNNGATGTTELTAWSTQKSPVAFRCVFEGSRGPGIRASYYNVRFISCEVFDCNQGNSVYGGVRMGTSPSTHLNCISHDNAFGDGFYSESNIHSLVRCVSDTNPGNGVTAGNLLLLVGCDLYNNTASGALVSANTSAAAINCNFAKNGEYGVEFSGSGGKIWIFNCGFGAGTFVNTTDFWQDESATNIISLTDQDSVYYPADTSPWIAPASGDFSIATDFSRATGYGDFTQTASSYSGTIAYNDVGAVPSDTDVSRVQVSISSLAISPPGHFVRYVDY